MKKIILFLTILLVLPLVYAGNYGAGTYSAGVYGVGEVISAPEDGDGGGGGGGCTYDWVCTNWFPAECPESKIQERICVNRGTCTGTANIPNQTRSCTYEGATKPLFDIFLTLPKKYKKICAGKKIKANIKLENYGKIELLDAFMTYWIINKNNTLISELKDTQAVEDKIDFEVAMEIPESTTQGTYRLYAQIVYADNKIAIAGESFEVVEGTDCQSYNLSKYIFFIIIGIVVIAIIILIILISRKSKKKKRKSKKKSLFKSIFKKKRKEQGLISYKRKVSRIIERNKK